MTNQIISQEGYDKLEKELRERKTIRRQKIANRIEIAKELGDLSENAEYTDAKEEQAFNEGRIIELTSLLKNVTIVQGNGNKNKIGMGSKITVKTNGEIKHYTIVSFNEVDPAEGKISNESPLGVAFSGKGKGDKATVTTPRGEIIYEILEIE